MTDPVSPPNWIAYDFEVGLALRKLTADKYLSGGFIADLTNHVEENNKENKVLIVLA